MIACRRAIVATFLFASICAVASAVVQPAPAWAAKFAPPESYSRTLPGGRLILVMIAPNPEFDRADDGFQLRQQYRSSGLYRMDGSAVWTVDWYSQHVEITNDGTYFVRFDSRVPPHQFEVDAVAFYCNGRLTRSYRVAELIDDPERMPRWTSGQWQKDRSFRPADGLLDVETLSGERFMFDIRTGEIVSEYRPVQWLRRVLRRVFVLGLIVVIGLCVAIGRSIRNLRAGTANRHSKPNNSGDENLAMTSNGEGIDWLKAFGGERGKQ